MLLTVRAEEESGFKTTKWVVGDDATHFDNVLRGVIGLDVIKQFRGCTEVHSNSAV